MAGPARRNRVIVAVWRARRDETARSSRYGGPGETKPRDRRDGVARSGAMSDAYAQSGVDTAAADAGVAALVGVLRTVELGRAARAVPLPGHFAAVLAIGPNLGIALGTDGVGSKLVVAEQARRYDTVGVDCVAMNVNDVVCVGAEPIALLDYLAVERADPGVMREIGLGLKRGAELAGVEIPGGEVAVLPELIRGHPSPNGIDLTAACVGLVALDAIVSGADCRPGDALIGVPSSGLHSNGYSLARAALASLALDDRPPTLGGSTVADALLEPTTIYVRAVLELLRSGLRVHGLAHITGGGLLNLTRLNRDIGFEIADPLPVPPVFDIVKELGAVADAEMWEVFNMGCGFCAVVPASTAAAATALLAAHHPGARRIGTVTDRAGLVEVPALGLALAS
jgi:phosphoribosylformylglycinamidine cyclo-ligase